jgi:mRNA interferase MazF
MALRRGDIVIVAHGEFGRPRPAIVVQANELGEDTTTVLVCPITSLVTERLPVRPIIEPDEKSGLRARSQIMTDKMFAVRRERVRQVIGAIGANSTDQLASALLVVLGVVR